MRRSWTLTAALALVSASQLWAPNCKKGKPCGNSCIPMSSTCHIDSSPPVSYPIVSTSRPRPVATSTPARASNQSSNVGLFATSDGDLDADVLYASQALLKALGFLKLEPSRSKSVAASGALMKFQRSKGLRATGVLDGHSLSLLADEVLMRSEAMGLRRR